MDHDYLRRLRRCMVTDLEQCIMNGEPISSAKETVLASRRLIINHFAKKDLLKFWESIGVEHLSKQARRADNIYSRYPQFRRQHRLPTLLERVWLHFSA